MVKTEILTKYRIIVVRAMKNVIFAQAQLLLTEQSKQLVFLRKDFADDEEWGMVRSDIRSGSVIGFTGAEDYVTQTGEPSLKIIHYKIEAKCELNIQFGKEYDDKIVNRKEDNRDLYNHEKLILDPTRAYNVLQFQRFVQKVRTYLSSFAIEFSTPILGSQYGGAEADPFKSERKEQDIYLRISPEIELKKLMAVYQHPIFEIGKCFRNEGQDKTHQPEFLSLEFYSSSYCIHDALFIINNILELDTKPIQRVSYADVQDEDQLPDGWVLWCEFPSEMCPFCKSDNGIGLRTVGYFNRMEIFELYEEENDPEIIKQNFPDRLDFIHAAEMGLPNMQGFGIGLERAFMAINGITDIREIQPYEFLRD